MFAAPPHSEFLCGFFPTRISDSQWERNLGDRARYSSGRGARIRGISGKLVGVEKMSGEAFYNPSAMIYLVECFSFWADSIYPGP